MVNGGIYCCGILVITMGIIMILHASLVFENHQDRVVIVAKYNTMNENYKLTCKLSTCTCNTQLNQSYTFCDNLDENSTPYCIGGSMCCEYKYDTCHSCSKVSCEEYKCNQECVTSVARSQCEYTCLKEYDQETINTVVCVDGERNITTHDSYQEYSSGTNPHVSPRTHLIVTNCASILNKYLVSSEFIAMAFFMGLFNLSLLFSICIELKYQRYKILSSVLNQFTTTTNPIV